MKTGPALCIRLIGTHRPRSAPRRPPPSSRIPAPLLTRAPCSSGSSQEAIRLIFFQGHQHVGGRNLTVGLSADPECKSIGCFKPLCVAEVRLLPTRSVQVGRVAIQQQHAEPPDLIGVPRTV